MNQKKNMWCCVGLSLVGLAGGQRFADRQREGSHHSTEGRNSGEEGSEPANGPALCGKPQALAGRATGERGSGEAWQTLGRVLKQGENQTGERGGSTPSSWGFSIK